VNLRTIVLTVIIVALGQSAQAADAKPRVEAVVDWANHRIELRAMWNLAGSHTFRNKAELRAELRSAILARLSRITGILWERAVAANVLGETEKLPDLAEFWGSRKLTTFQVAENQASATMDISLRGRDSLMANLPARAASLDWESLADNNDPEAVYEKRANSGLYDASEIEPLLYTGLIIDARHLNFKPSFNTGIYSSSGRQLYGAEFLSRATAVKRGVAGFAAGEGNGELRQRAGKRPLRVSALDLTRTTENALVISDEDAARLFAHDGSIKNLRRARVVVIVSPTRIAEAF
jgi:hypothetical protein